MALTAAAIGLAVGGCAGRASDESASAESEIGGPHAIWTVAQSEGEIPDLKNAVVAFDAERGVLVAFGQRDYYTTAKPLPPTDTYEYANGTWKRFAADAAGPTSRSGHAMAYDPVRKKVVLFGGAERGYTQHVDDTWEWDGASWTSITPAAGSDVPSPRAHHAMIFDPVRGKVVLFGGGGSSQGTPVWSNELFTFDGIRWVKETPAGTPPEPRTGAAMAFDETLGRIVIFGGTGEPATSSGNYPQFGDTWAWDGARWDRIAQGGPDARVHAAMSFDPEIGHVLLSAGKIGSGRTVQYGTDLWRLDGNRWREVKDIRGPGLPRCYQHTMLFDTTRRATLVYGCDYATGMRHFGVYANRAPQFAPLPDRQVFPGERVGAFVSARDPDVETFALSQKSLPPGATFSRQARDSYGRFFWTPLEADRGDHVATFQADDGELSSEIQMKIHVGDVSYAMLDTGVQSGRFTERLPAGQGYMIRGSGGYRATLSDWSVRCELEGQNPGRSSVRCHASGSYFSQARLGASPNWRSFGAEGEGYIEDTGRFEVQITPTRNESAKVTGKLVRSADGALVSDGLRIEMHDANAMVNVSATTRAAVEVR